MRIAHPEVSCSVPRGRLAAVLAGAAAGLASLTGCFTTHTIPPRELPAALEAAPERDVRRVVQGEEGKPVELPSPEHLRWVQVDLRSGGTPVQFAPPVTAKLASDGLHVDGKGLSRTYPLSDIQSIRLRHDDHKADAIGGTILLSFGVSSLAAASIVVAADLSRSCDECFRGLTSVVIGAPLAGGGLLLGIPGVILTSRGVGGLGDAPKEQATEPKTPVVSVGPGSAVVTVPF